EAVQGSPDVIINGRAALRAGDPGGASSAGAPAAWQAGQGSRGVFINGMPAFRYGDETGHTGGNKGELVEGSPDVFVGDGAPGTPKDQPHDKSATVDVSDALGRPLDDVGLSVSCPHQQRDRQQINGSAAVGGLCKSATVTVDKALQAGTWDDNASQ